MLYIVGYQLYWSGSTITWVKVAGLIRTRIQVHHLYWVVLSGIQLHHMNVYLNFLSSSLMKCLFRFHLYSSLSDCAAQNSSESLQVNSSTAKWERTLKWKRWLLSRTSTPRPHVQCLHINVTLSYGFGEELHSLQVTLCNVTFCYLQRSAQHVASSICSKQEVMWKW